MTGVKPFKRENQPSSLYTSYRILIATSKGGKYILPYNEFTVQLASKLTKMLPLSTHSLKSAVNTFEL